MVTGFTFQAWSYLWYLWVFSTGWKIINYEIINENNWAFLLPFSGVFLLSTKRQHCWSSLILVKSSSLNDSFKFFSIYMSWLMSLLFYFKKRIQRSSNLRGRQTHVQNKVSTKNHFLAEKVYGVISNSFFQINFILIFSLDIHHKVQNGEFSFWQKGRL